MSKRGWILFLALGAIWGTPYLLIRIAVESIDRLWVAFGRTPDRDADSPAARAAARPAPVGARPLPRRRAPARAFHARHGAGISPGDRGVDHGDFAQTALASDGDVPRSRGRDADQRKRRHQQAVEQDAAQDRR